MLIAIDGAIAAGKTTLAAALSETHGATLVAEDFTSVETLEDFYRDPPTYAFETELAFTRMHASLLRGAAEMPADLVVDFTLERDLAFARMTLTDKPERFNEWLTEWQMLFEGAPRPDAVILLACPVEVLMARIVRRGRPFERDIQEEYLAGLFAGIEKAYEEFPPQELIRVDSSMPLADYVSSEHLRKILRAVDSSARGTGR